MKAHKLYDDTAVYWIKLTHTGAGATITIPIEAIRTLGWHRGHALALALVERDDERERLQPKHKRSPLEFSGLVITRDQNAPFGPEYTRSYTVVNADGSRSDRGDRGDRSAPRIHPRVRICRLRVQSTPRSQTYMVTVPREFLYALRWNASDREFDHRGRRVPMTLAMVVMSDGVVVSCVEGSRYGGGIR